MWKRQTFLGIGAIPMNGEEERILARILSRMMDGGKKGVTVFDYTLIFPAPPLPIVQKLISRNYIQIKVTNTI